MKAAVLAPRVPAHRHAPVRARRPAWERPAIHAPQTSQTLDARQEHGMGFAPDGEVSGEVADAIEQNAEAIRQAVEAAEEAAMAPRAASLFPTGIRTDDDFDVTRTQVAHAPTNPTVPFGERLRK